MSIIPHFPRPYFVTMFSLAMHQQQGYLKYLELGVHIGETIRAVGATVPTAECFGVDVNDRYVGTGNIKTYQMTTLEYLGDHAAQDGPFNTAYIDADHAFGSVRADLLALWPHMADQSLVFLDDTWPGKPEDTVPGLCNDAYRMQGWLRANGYEAVTIPCEPGFTIVRKSSRPLAWGPQ